MPRLLDDSDIEEDGEKKSANLAPQNYNHHHHHHQLVRSPSDTSLMYLSQLSSFFASAEDTKKPPPPSLPCKRRTTRICPDVAPQVHQQQKRFKKVQREKTPQQQTSRTSYLKAENDGCLVVQQQQTMSPC